jgi:hypothetical protein
MGVPESGEFLGVGEWGRGEEYGVKSLAPW